MASSNFKLQFLNNDHNNDDGDNKFHMVHHNLLVPSLLLAICILATETTSSETGDIYF